MPESTFRELADNAPVMIWRSGVDKLCDWFNKPWLDFTGRTMGQELGNGWAEGVHPDDFDRCLNVYTSAFDARENFSMTYRLRRHDGAWRWILDKGTPFNRDGKFAGYFGSCIDVTEQREEHDQLVFALEQRDALVSEVYHRVKNNLQQIEGLIAVESMTLTDPEAVRGLRSVSGRVRAMGAVHQMLMRSESLASIRADTFLSNLCADIGRAGGAEARGLTIEVDAASRDLNIDTALTLGLLVNELVTNAVKHAFPDDRKGRITVRFGRIGDDATALEVADNGAGLPDRVLAPVAGRSGFRLVHGFVDQLRGRLIVGDGPGAIIRVAMP